MNIASIVLSQSSDETTIHHVRPSGAIRSCSMNTLKRRTLTLSAQLLRGGIRPGDHVLIHSANCAEAIEALLAACGVGAIAVPVSPQLSTASIVFIVRNIRPKAVIFDRAVDDKIAAALLGCCQMWISINGASVQTNSMILDFENLASTGEELTEFPDQDPSHVAVIIHSSGSTGTPKGVTRTHRVMEICVASIANHYSRRRLEAIRGVPQIVPLPVCHFGGLGPCLTAIYLGRPTYIMESFDPLKYLKLISLTRSESLILVPSMYSLLLRQEAIDELDLSAVKYCYLVAEASNDTLAAQVAERFGAASISVYAMTEGMSGIGYGPEELESGNVRTGSCGRHRSGELRLVGPAGDSQEQFGELWVRNDTIEQCYTDPSLNDQRFVDGWLKTGDLFYRDSEGYFYWRGRCDDMFVYKGNNLYPIEIEAAFMSHALVTSACVAPIVDRQGITIPAAAVITKATVSSQELLRFLARHISTRAMPAFIHFVQELPTIGPGKVSRSAVAKLLQQSYDTRMPASENVTDARDQGAGLRRN